jgi:hypothetical protein
MTLVSLLRAFARRQEGTLIVIAALVFPVLIGIVGLVSEYGYGLVTKAEAQRASDISAYAGALAYNAKGTTTAMESAAAYVASLNGIGAAHISASFGTSPRLSTNSAVRVNIGATRPLMLAPVIGGPDSLTVNSNAYAQITQSSSACIIALSGTGTGITFSGGTRVTAQDCAVSSNVSVSVPCGTTVNAKNLTYNGAVPSQPCNGITTTSGIAKKPVTDPLAGEPAVTAAISRISTVAALTSPSAPVITGADITFPYWGDPSFSIPGCTSAYANGTWTVSCPANTLNFGNITINGAVKFNVGTTKTYNIKSITVGGGSNGTFGGGTFNIGKSTNTCSGNATSSTGNSICNTATLTFEGPSTFVLAGGIYNSGGASLTLGSGTANSFKIGVASDSSSLNLGGGATTKLADATGSSGAFQLTGNVSTGGGSCTVLSAASQHDIKGFLSGAGAVILGSGVYTVNGYIAFGANGGGNSSCNGSSVGVSGTGVTLVTAGASTSTGSSCSGKAFCIGAGYSNVDITAPTSGATAKLVVVGPTTTSNTAGAAFAEGASGNSLSGAFYFPNGPISLSGGASLGDVPGGCLQLIGSSISLAGGTAAASSCFSSSAASAVVLVQ